MKKIFNIIIVICGILTQIVLVILLHQNVLDDIYEPMFISSLVVALLLLVVNALENWIKSIILAVLSFVIVVGSCFSFMCIDNLSTFIYTQSANIHTINKIVEDNDNLLLFSYADYDYYVDRDYEYMYEIKQDGFKSVISINKILIENDLGEIANHVGQFYDLSQADRFSTYGEGKVFVSLAQNMSDISAIVKMLSPDNKVFYSYLSVRDPKSFISDLNISSQEIVVNNYLICVTKASKVINGIEIDNNQIFEYESGSRYLITVGNKVYSSSIMPIRFDDNVGYYDRINYYLNADIYIEIEKCQQSLNNYFDNSEEYKNLLTYIESLKSSQVEYTIELHKEVSDDQYTYKFYRVYIPGNTLEETPIVTVVEIFGEDYCMYSRTEMDF